jgi:hypothetical protein
MSAFQLSKWYLDCVATDGSAFIGYWARLSWRRLRLEYAAFLFAPIESRPRQLHSLGSSPPPIIAGQTCTWSCSPLGIVGRWESTASSIRRTLLRSQAGAVHWFCHQPRADVTLRFGGSRAGAREAALTGLGYVEELNLTIPPWRLPFDTLRWGRFVSAEHALVWLEWERAALAGRGRSSRRLAALDGKLTSRPIAGEREVTVPNAHLQLGDTRTLREGALTANALSAVPQLVRLLPRRFKRAHESKRLSAGTLLIPGKAPSTGWVIHEVVRW